MRVLILTMLFTGLLIYPLVSKSASNNTNHGPWNELLNKYVSTDGKVNYKGFQSAQIQLDDYLKILSDNVPDDSWEENAKLAYWINAYNAFTIKLIIAHYPINSIMEIDKAWDIKFINLGGKSYSLNEIEHEIIRIEFDEPRIHFALVCAAISCPILLNEAYEASKLDQQLQQQGELFINDPSKNIIKGKKIMVSQIFNWFNEDFTKNGSLIDYLNLFTVNKIPAKTKVEFMEYDWSLND